MKVINKAKHARHIGILLNPGPNTLNEKQQQKFEKVFSNPKLEHLRTDIEVLPEKESEKPAARKTKESASNDTANEKQ